MLTRRELLTRTAAFALLARSTPAAAQSSTQLCLFSKHLPELAWADLGRAIKDCGFDGVDLTVRDGGHVLPERVVDDLPRALDAIRAQGVSVPMITTELTSAASPTAKPILQTAARHGVRYFKAGYWRYAPSGDVRAQVNDAGKAIEGLAALAHDCGIEMGVHNHAGYIGGALWEVAPFMDKLDPKWAGYYFDPRHAVAEGGGGAWKAAAKLVAPRLKMVALKDFQWTRSGTGWRIDDCPLGEGQVDWQFVGTFLREARFSGPVSLHLEYKIPEGTQHTLAAAMRDLKVARRILGFA